MHMANMTPPTAPPAALAASAAPTATTPTAVSPSAVSTPLLSTDAHSTASKASPTSAQSADRGCTKALSGRDPSIQGPSPAQQVENVMDELMLEYLRRRGYRVERASVKNESTVPSDGGSNDVEMTAVDGTPNGAQGDGDVVMDDVEGSSTVVVKKENNASEVPAPAPIPEDEKRRVLGMSEDAHGYDNASRIALARRRRSASDATRADQGDGVTLERYAQQLGLTTESCAANHILFHGLTGGDPNRYSDGYAALMDWICNALEMYKYELHAVAFPLFVHSYLDLLVKGHLEAAKAFFHRFAGDHMRLHVSELRQLSLLFSPAHVTQNEYAQQVLHGKFNVQLSLLSFELLHAFLSQEQLFLMLAMVNERVNLIVVSNQPGLPLQHLEDVGHDGEEPRALMNLVQRTEASGYMTSDQVAQVVANANVPNESEVAAPIAGVGAYNLEYEVAVAGGEGSTVEALHAIKVNWGVLPARKLPMEPDQEGTGSGAGKTEEENGNSGAGHSGVNGVSSSGATSASTSSGGTGDSGNAAVSGSGGGETDKKVATGSSTSADGAASGDATATASTSKGGDKSSNKNGADKSSATGAGDANRKGKRARLATDPELDRRKSELEAMGPLPDRKNAFNGNVLERLVLRQPAEMTTLATDDLRARASLNKRQLPSALCFSLVNSGTHVNDMCFSDDVTMVGASCEDGSFRVWRNDDQPLGTARGSVYQGDPADTEEDEKTAVLRGHSSAIYGACFSPDNRFALTSSADSTVRLWSLAAKSNVVIYRSHESYPVWDVRFGRYGYYFASCSMDRTARLWSTDRMTPLRVFAGHLSDVDCVEFHPNLNYMATGSSDKTVRLWDIQSGKCVRILSGHFQGVSCLAFSRNGRYLASSGEDRYINIWDLQAGKRLETLIGHKDMVTSLNFSQESTILASSGLDATVRLWDMQTMVDKPTPTTRSTTSGSSPFSPKPTASGSNLSSQTFTKPLQMVRPNAIHELPPSRFLLRTLRSKQTPMYRVQFTPRNLLLSGGVFRPTLDA